MLARLARVIRLDYFSMNLQELLVELADFVPDEARSKYEMFASREFLVPEVVKFLAKSGTS